MDGPNTYLYAGNNPLMYTDPYGLFSLDPLWATIDFTTGGWTPSQTTTNVVSGFGNGITFGLLNKTLNTSRHADPCSTSYQYSSGAGNVVGSFASGGAALKGLAHLSKFQRFRVLNNNRYLRIGPGKHPSTKGKVPMLRIGPSPWNIRNSSGQFSKWKARLTHWRI